MASKGKKKPAKKRRAGTKKPAASAKRKVPSRSQKTLPSMKRAITKRADEALRRQSVEVEAARERAENDGRLLAAVMEALPIGVAIIDVRGGTIQSNRAFEQVWGGPRPVTRTVEDYAAYKAWWADTGMPVLPEEWASAIAVQKGKTTVGQLIRIQRFDGSNAFIINSASPVRDAEGNIVGCAVAIEDITELKRTEEALQRVNEELELRILERASDLIRANKELKEEIVERKRVEERLRENELLLHAALESLRDSGDQLRNLSAHLQAVREEERATIAREIHDELGQVLTALKMDLSWVAGKYRDHEELNGKTKAMLTIIDSTIQTVKRVVTELRPGVLDHLGLSAAVEWQAGEFRKLAGIPCDVRIDPEDIVLDRDCSTHLFRIFQETMTNIVRHAEATRIKVCLEKKGERIQLIVEDNGNGITDQQISSPSSFGLIGIRERIHFLGGDIKITGVPNKGTSIEVSVPLRKSE